MGLDPLDPSDPNPEIRLYTFDSKARFSDQASPPDPIVL
jgi:hypothetical protein